MSSAAIQLSLTAPATPVYPINIEAQSKPQGKSRFKKLINDLSDFTDSDKIRSQLNLAAEVSNAVATAFANVREIFSEIADALGKALGVLGIFSIVNYVQWWTCEKAKRWEETASMIGFTILKVLNIVKFMAELKFYSLAKVAVNVGKGIPIIGLVFNLLEGESEGFNFVHNIKELKANKREYQQHDSKLVFWKGLKKEQTSASFAADSTFIGKLKKEGMNITILDGKTEEQKRKSVDSLINRQVQKYEKLLQDDLINRKKTWIAIATDIISLAIVTLTLIGLIAGIGALASTGGLMIALGLFSAGLWVYKAYFASANKTSSDVWMPDVVSLNTISL